MLEQSEAYAVEKNPAGGPQKGPKKAKKRKKITFCFCTINQTGNGRFLLVFPTPILKTIRKTEKQHHVSNQTIRRGLHLATTEYIKIQFIISRTVETTFSYGWICQNSSNMICSHPHRQFTCKVSVQYLNNSTSTGYASNFLLQSLKQNL